jgi:hypothetical protein
MQLSQDIEYGAPLLGKNIKTWSVWHVATTSCPTYARRSEEDPLLLLPPEPNNNLTRGMQKEGQGMAKFAFYHQDFANCSQTTMVRILPKCPYWELQTLDRTGMPKAEGGDEFYVTYTDDAVAHDNGHLTAVAEITDMQNGRYRLSFVSSPLNHRYHRLLGSGNITISFQYTCGIGQMAPPTKNALSWKTGGNIVAQYSTHVDTLPPITPFIPPSRKSIEDLSQFLPHIVPYGDSIMQQFMAPLSIQLPNIGRPLNTSTVSDWISRLDRLYAFHLKQANAVLVVSSHAWDLLEMENTASHVDHGQAIQQFVNHVRKTYPNVTLAWKSPTALHIHVPMLQINDGRDQELKRQFGQKFYDRLRYMSTSRSFALYQFQKQLCEEVLQIPFLDVYQASYLSADHTKIGDGRHFLPNLNAMMVHWFVGTSRVETLWKLHQTKRKKRVLRATITDCDESSWVTMTNAAIISMVTNRRLEWSTNCSMPFRGVSATTNYNINDKSIMSFEESYAAPLTLADLETNGYLKTDPSQRMAKELFSEGDDFFHGMLLHALLEWPTTTSPALLPTTKAFDSSESVVFAVQQGPFLLDTESLDICMIHLQNATQSVATTSLPCHVLFSSQELASKWHSKLETEYNCSAIISATTTSPDSSFAYMELVAEMAYDGYMGPCSSTIMYGKLIHYLRFKNARTRGELPLNELPTCCWN